jgi:hypothetical protein
MEMARSSTTLGPPPWTGPGTVASTYNDGLGEEHEAANATISNSPKRRTNNVKRW